MSESKANAVMAQVANIETAANLAGMLGEGLRTLIGDESSRHLADLLRQFQQDSQLKKISPSVLSAIGEKISESLQTVANMSHESFLEKSEQIMLNSQQTISKPICVHHEMLRLSAYLIESGHTSANANLFKKDIRAYVGYILMHLLGLSFSYGENPRSQKDGLMAIQIFVGHLLKISGRLFQSSSLTARLRQSNPESAEQTFTDILDSLHKQLGKGIEELDGQLREGVSPQKSLKSCAIDTQHCKILLRKTLGDLMPEHAHGFRQGTPVLQQHRKNPCVIGALMDAVGFTLPAIDEECHRETKISAQGLEEQKNVPSYHFQTHTLDLLSLAIAWAQSDEDAFVPLSPQNAERLAFPNDYRLSIGNFVFNDIHTLKEKLAKDANLQRRFVSKGLSALRQLSEKSDTDSGARLRLDQNGNLVLFAQQEKKTLLGSVYIATDAEPVYTQSMGMDKSLLAYTPKPAREVMDTKSEKILAPPSPEASASHFRQQLVQRSLKKAQLVYAINSILDLNNQVYELFIGHGDVIGSILSREYFPLMTTLLSTATRLQTSLNTIDEQLKRENHNPSLKTRLRAIQGENTTILDKFKDMRSKSQEAQNGVMATLKNTANGDISIQATLVQVGKSLNDVKLVMSSCGLLNAEEQAQLEAYIDRTQRQGELAAALDAIIQKLAQEVQANGVIENQASLLAALKAGIQQLAPELSVINPEETRTRMLALMHENEALIEEKTVANEKITDLQAQLTQTQAEVQAGVKSQVPLASYIPPIQTLDMPTFGQPDLKTSQSSDLRDNKIADLTQDISENFNSAKNDYAQMCSQMSVSDILYFCLHHFFGYGEISPSIQTTSESMRMFAEDAMTIANQAVMAVLENGEADIASAQTKMMTVIDMFKSQRKLFFITPEYEAFCEASIRRLEKSQQMLTQISVNPKWANLRNAAHLKPDEKQDADVTMPKIRQYEEARQFMLKTISADDCLTQTSDANAQNHWRQALSQHPLLTAITDLAQEVNAGCHDVNDFMTQTAGLHCSTQQLGRLKEKLAALKTAFSAPQNLALAEFYAHAGRLLYALDAKINEIRTAKQDADADLQAGLQLSVEALQDQLEAQTIAEIKIQPNRSSSLAGFFSWGASQSGRSVSTMPDSKSLGNRLALKHGPREIQQVPLPLSPIRPSQGPSSLSAFRSQLASSPSSSSVSSDSYTVEYPSHHQTLNEPPASSLSDAKAQLASSVSASSLGSSDIENPSYHLEIDADPSFFSTSKSSPSSTQTSQSFESDQSLRLAVNTGNLSLNALLNEYLARDLLEDADHPGALFGASARHIEQWLNDQDGSQKFLAFKNAVKALKCKIMPLILSQSVFSQQIAHVYADLKNTRPSANGFTVRKEAALQVFCAFYLKEMTGIRQKNDQLLATLRAYLRADLHIETKKAETAGTKTNPYFSYGFGFFAPNAGGYGEIVDSVEFAPSLPNHADQPALAEQQNAAVPITRSNAITMPKNLLVVQIGQMLMSPGNPFAEEADSSPRNRSGNPFDDPFDDPIDDQDNQGNQGNQRVLVTA